VTRLTLNNEMLRQKLKKLSE